MILTATTPLDAAIQYAEMGYKVFPCSPQDKKPVSGSNGVLDATTDVEQITAWWTAMPNANVGMATTGMLVIDIDGADNPWLEGAPEKLSELAVGPMSVTPRGGRHHLFRQPAGITFRNTVSKLSDKVDTRGVGGYIVVAPSVVRAKAYRWETGFDLDCSPDELPDPPAWLIELLGDSAQPDGAAVPRLERASESNRIPDGQRNHTLARLGGTMRRTGMSQDEIEAALMVANRTRCSPPLPDAEVEKIAWSVARYEPDQISVAMAENHFGQMYGGGESRADDDDDSDATFDPGSFPEHLMEVPGLISEVIKYNRQTAFRDQPVLALASAIALVAAMAGRKVRDESNTRTNMYVIGLADAGAGKEHGRKLNRHILTESGQADLIGPGDIKSSSGLLNVVEAKPSVLLQIDEIGRWLMKTKSTDNGQGFQVIGELLQLFSRSDGVHDGSAYADLTRTKLIVQPSVVVYGVNVPDGYYESLTIESLSDGFQARLLVFESPGLPFPNLKATTDFNLPASVLAMAKEWADFEPTAGNLASVNPTPTVMNTTDRATKMFEDFIFKIDEIQRAERKERRGVWSRCFEKARKLALVYACSEGGPYGVIDEKAAAWAIELVMYLTQRTVLSVDRWLASSKHEAQINAVRRLLADAPGMKMERWKLNRRAPMRSMSKRERTELVESMVDLGHIRMVLTDASEGKNGGKAKTEFELVNG